jgi:hypothetical protein
MVTDRLFAVLPRTADQDADGRPAVGGCALAGDPEHILLHGNAKSDEDIGDARVAVRRERMSDLLARDVL